MFRDREDAGQRLAEALAPLKPELVNPVVLALPRGGVPVALPVARALGAPLDVVLVRKIGAPHNPEVAAGAVVDGPAHRVVFNPQVLRMLGLTEADFQPQIARKLEEIEARRKMWLGDRAPVDVTGRSVIVVDDGVATGATMRAALAALADKNPHELIVAVPVAAPDTLRELEPLADRIIALEAPWPFHAVGLHYQHFGQVDDNEVTEMLAQARGSE